MHQLSYVSTNLIAGDNFRLDALTVQAQTNNLLAGITGLLWSDSEQFSQVVEGERDQLTTLLFKLRADPRHTGMRVLEFRPVVSRQYGEWSMMRPAREAAALPYEVRMVARLAKLGGEVAGAFNRTIERSRLALGA